jgi:hypothetical protein
MAARKEFWNFEKPSDSSHYGTVKQTMSVAPHIAINLFFLIFEQNGFLTYIIKYLQGNTS